MQKSHESQYGLLKFALPCPTICIHSLFMDILYFAFANDPNQPLDELKREDIEINRILEPLAAKGSFKIVRDSFATLDMVADKLSLYKNDLVLFHFSGHAGPNSIQLDGALAQSKGIAAFLAMCPRLKLVVLNGCATFNQVKLLHEHKVPAVIATHRPVQDALAAVFAIQFYRSLAQLDHLNSAFDTGRSKVLALDAALPITRGLDLRGKPANEPCWGLNVLEGREDVGDWRLPVFERPMEGDYSPNQVLLESLLKAFKNYIPEIKNILEDEENLIDRSILDKREAVLKALPHPISEQVRFLLTPRSSNTTGMVFYDQPGLDRLKQMSVVYDTIAELMGFIMLAQLWDILSDPKTKDFPISAEVREAIRSLLCATAETRQVWDPIDLVRKIRITLDNNQSNYFIKELKVLQEAYREGTSFYDACRFFIDLKPRFKTLGKEAAPLSIIAEQQLANFFSILGFVCRYYITSVKNIDVLKNRSIRNPRYRHILVKLIQRFVGLEEIQEILTSPLDSSSVLIIREEADGSRQFLNLTPFVIDENAFDEKATVAKVHFFERYLHAQDAYVYRHIYMPGDMPLVITDQRKFKILKSQYDAFSEIIFNKPMREL